MLRVADAGRHVARRKPWAVLHYSTSTKHDPYTVIDGPNRNANWNPSSNSDGLPISPQSATTLDSTSSNEATNEQTRSNSTRPSLDIVKSRVNNWIGVGSATVREHVDTFSAKLATTFTTAGAQLNRVTGYDDIDALKKEVVRREAQVYSVRQATREAKRSYERAVQQRSLSQREVNDLLARRSTWSDADMSHFTDLIKQDHLYEQAEATAKAAAENADNMSDQEFGLMMRAILARYHEEQVWSDKIRSASTYGQLTILGMNLFIFVLAIVLVEPWKRRRMAKAFEEKVEALNAETRELVVKSVEGIAGRLDNQDQMMRKRIADALGEEGPVAAYVPLETTAIDGNEEENNSSAADLPLLARVTTYPNMLAAGAAFSAGILGWLLRGWTGS